MKKLKKIIYWVLLNGFQGWLLYSFLFCNIKWAGNLVKFLIWFEFLCSILVMFGITCSKDEKWKAKLLKNKSPIPPNLNYFIDILFACFLASFGFYLYASFKILSPIMVQVGYESLENNKEEDKI